MKDLQSCFLTKKLLVNTLFGFIFLVYAGSSLISTKSWAGNKKGEYSRSLRTVGLGCEQTLSLNGSYKIVEKQLASFETLTAHLKDLLSLEISDPVLIKLVQVLNNPSVKVELLDEMMMDKNLSTMESASSFRHTHSIPKLFLTGGIVYEGTNGEAAVSYKEATFIPVTTGTRSDQAGVSHIKLNLQNLAPYPQMLLLFRSLAKAYYFQYMENNWEKFSKVFPLKYIKRNKVTYLNYEAVVLAAEIFAYFVPFELQKSLVSRAKAEGVRFNLNFAPEPLPHQIEADLNSIVESLGLDPRLLGSVSNFKEIRRIVEF